MLKTNALLNGWIQVLLFAVLAIVGRARLIDFRPAESDLDEVSTVWHPQLYRLVTFGHTAAAVDLQLIRFMTDGRIDHVKKGKHPKIFYYLDLATDLDPKFFSLYTAGAGFLSVARNDAPGALHLITKGENFRSTQLRLLPEEFQTNYWTDEWRIPFIKGYVELFELGDFPAAVGSFTQLDQIPGTPLVLRQMGESLKTPAGRFRTAERTLALMIETATDPVVKAELEKKRASLPILRFLHLLNDEFRSWTQSKPALKKLAERQEWKTLYSRFSSQKSLSSRDPWGGTLFITDEGKIDSTTPRMEVLGIR